MKKTIIFVIVILLMIGIVSALDISTDDFESYSFSGGSGWLSSWSYTGSCTITTLSNPIGNYQLRGYNNCDISRNTNTYSYQNTKISFYATATSLENADHCHYYVDGVEVLTLNNGDDDGVLKYYEYNITPSTTTTIRMISPNSFGDYCYLDNVVVSGEEITPELKVYNELSYVSGGMMSVPLTSTLTNIPHQFEVLLSNGSVVCNETLVSPSVAETTFYGECLLPNIIENNAIINFYADGTNITTKSFNIVGLQHNTQELNIERVYFSPQVLQGGSTEVFAIVKSNSSITNIGLTLTFPDNTTRHISMSPTTNTDEYRAFITDTYKVGNTSFTIRVENNLYYDYYSNQYQVVAYNVDFVDLVNNVNSILTQPPTIDVLGTYYEVGDEAKVIAQLSSQGLAINNASCFASIYNPDNSLFLRNEFMDYVPDSDGLYTYDVILPLGIVGVYPVSVLCDYITSTYSENLSNETVVHGIRGSYNLSAYDEEDGVVASINSDTVGLRVNYNFSVTNVSNMSDLFVQWFGTTTFNNIRFYWECSNGSEVLASNIISSGLIEQTFLKPDCVNITDIINSGYVNVFFESNESNFMGEKTIFEARFENATTSPMNEVGVSGNPVFGTRNSVINGTNAYIIGSDDGIDDEGELVANVNLSGYTNITVQYSRIASGTESGELHKVYVKGGNVYYNLTEDWETGDFSSQDYHWAENNWFVSGTVNIGSSQAVHNGSYGLRLRSNDGWVDRGINFNGQQGDVIVSFWAKLQSLENGEYAYFKVETTPNSDTYTTIKSWTNGDDDDVWHYYSFNLSEYGIILGSNTEIAFESAMSGGGDYFYVDDINIELYGDYDNVLESWYANSPLTIKTFSLGSEYDNSDNFSLHFYSYADFPNDYFEIDDVLISGYKNNSYTLITDKLGLQVINPVGVVNEVRGGGEFNVKDRLSGIEDSLDIIANNMNLNISTSYIIDYIMPDVYGATDAPIVALYLHEKDDNSIGIDGADCTATIRGKATNTSPGAIQLTEYPLTSMGGGRYYGIPISNSSWESGIYQIETNCEIIGEGTFYGVEGFRMEENYMKELDNISVSISGLNVTLIEVSNATSENSTEIPFVMIGGTEYYGGDDGLVAIRLIKSNRNGKQSLITGATCMNTIYYPNMSVFINASPMIELGNGVYYDNFTVPNNEGVYVYSVDCNKGTKNYYAMNTFHVQHFFNWSVDFSVVYNYLQDINGSVTTIDGRIINLTSDVTDLDAKVVLMNGTITDIYSLLVDMNQTLNEVYALSGSINATVIGINGTVTNIESITLSLNDTLVVIHNDMIVMNTTINTMNATLNNVNNTMNTMNATLNTMNTTMNGMNSLLQNMSSNDVLILDYLVNLTTEHNNQSIILQEILSYVEDINSTQYDYSQNFTNIMQNLTNVYSLLENVSDTQLQVIIPYLQDINMSVNEGLSIAYVMNSSLENLTMLSQKMNITLWELYALNQYMNNTLYYMNETITNVNSSVTDINISVVEVLQDLYSMNISLQEIQDFLANMSINISSLTNLSNLMNQTLFFMNNTVNDMNITINNMNSTLNTINTTVTQTLQNTQTIITSLIDMNGTIITIQNGVMEINVTTNTLEDIILAMNNTMNSMNNTLNNVNNTMNNMNITLNEQTVFLQQLALNISLHENKTEEWFLSLNDSLTDIHTLLLNMNGSLWELRNISLRIETITNNINNTVNTINNTANSLVNITNIIENNTNILINMGEYINGTTITTYNLLLTMNTSVASLLPEILLIQDMLVNQSDYLHRALADISYYDINLSGYLLNATLLTPSIFETQLLQLRMNTSQPLEGDYYNAIITYINKDTGEVTKSVRKEVVGNESVILTLSSEGLDPINKALQEYYVFLRLEMLDGEGLWESFYPYYVGELTVNNLVKRAGRAGLYDVSIRGVYGVYDKGDAVPLLITLKNTGDIPDEDTILTYWLEDSDGYRYAVTKEQILEVPVGTSVLKRSLRVPLTAQNGEWKLGVAYETTVQPLITAVSTVEVADMSFWEKLNERAPVIFRNHIVVFWLFIFIIIVMFIFMFFLLMSNQGYRGKRGKKPEFTL